MRQVNLKKLAQELNLSISTVSRALSDSHEISAETKNKVHQLAKELNYQPNPYARSLRNHKSKTIAIIIPEVDNNFFSLAINGIEEVAQQNGYHVLIYITHENNEKEIAFAHHLLNGRVEGIIMSLSGEVTTTEHIHILKNNKIPIVFFDRICEEADTVNVITNDYESGYLATDHLIKKGCKTIAFLAFLKTHSISKKRLEGYLDALLKNNLDINQAYIIDGTTDYNQNYEKVKRLLLLDNRPAGIFASVEQLALIVYEVCDELHLKIPDDVKVISFSNLRTASLLNPALTTITQPAFDIGKEAAKALFYALSKKITSLESKNIVLTSTLIERKSTSN